MPDTPPHCARAGKSQRLAQQMIDALCGFARGLRPLGEAIAAVGEALLDDDQRRPGERQGERQGERNQVEYWAPQGIPPARPLEGEPRVMAVAPTREQLERMLRTDPMVRLMRDALLSSSFPTPEDLRHYRELFMNWPIDVTRDEAGRTQIRRSTSPEIRGGTWEASETDVVEDLTNARDEIRAPRPGVAGPPPESPHFDGNPNMTVAEYMRLMAESGFSQQMARSEFDYPLFRPVNIYREQELLTEIRRTIRAGRAEGAKPAVVALCADDHRQVLDYLSEQWAGRSGSALVGAELGAGIELVVWEDLEPGDIYVAEYAMARDQGLVE